MKKILLAASLVTLGACSTVTTGTSQPFTVNTAEVNGATCDLVDSKGARWTVTNTPETREITKGDGPLTVTCSKAGYKTASVTVEEYFAGATLGNVILGGGIGLVVDAASGAAQEYPDEVTLWLEPNTFSSASAKGAWFAKKDAYEEAQKAKKEQQHKDVNDQEAYN